MPTFPSGRTTVLVAALLLFVPASPAQEEGGSLREIQVQEILAACKGATIPRIWEQSEKLIALGSPAKRAIQQGIKEAPVESRLCGLRALIGLDSPTFAAEKLMDLALDEEHGVDYRVAAIDLVGLTDEIDAEDGLMELLFTFNPQVRIAAARALWNLESDKSQRAKDVLREFLDSSDPELQARGALALAEMGDGETPGVKETLNRLRREPGLRGQLADALYRHLNLKRAMALRDLQDERSKSRGASPRWVHLDEIRELIRRGYEFPEEADDEKLRENAAHGMLQFPSDPHTQFMTPEEYREFLHGSDGVDPSYGGIGAFIDTNITDRFRILRPIFGGPAWKADIQGGDDIIAVNGKPTQGRSTTDIIKEVKGPPGTPVILTIYREGWPETRDITVIRAKIVLPTVFSRMLPGGIGLIEVAQFAMDTGNELKAHLLALEAQGLRALVIDLRDNPGGLLGSVIDCLSLFLKQGELVCTARGKLYRLEKYHSNRADRERPYPISVLVNGRSASGAELMSGVLQYYSKSSPQAGAPEPYVDAVVIGASTFGKGTMQRTLPLQTWPGEEFKDVPRKDGHWDPREPFVDQNGNGQWDDGEPYEDKAWPNGRWDEAEPWEDKNGNGKWDEGEGFTDVNGDGSWNDKEEFTDSNGNGQYDYGAAVKMSVARYYLPGGRNFTRTREWDAATGKHVYRGGVEPDEVLEADRLEVASLVELRALQEKGVFRDYVKDHWARHKETFRSLADFDGRDPARYPDFDAFYQGLKTRLTRQDVRRAVRIEVRREVSVEQGKEIQGDVSDDNILRRGVEDVLRRLGQIPADIPEYAELFPRVSEK